MAISFISIKCPECGAQLNIDEGRSMTFCQYCGTKILINNENEFIYRTVDEAAVKQAEIEKMRLEIEEKKRAAEEKEKAEAIAQKKVAARKLGIVTLCLFLLGVGFVVIFKGNEQVAPIGAIPLLISFITGILAADSALKALGVLDLETEKKSKKK